MTLFSLPGQDDPVYQAGVMLLNGYGFNWYRLDNQMRADDLLIRSKASENLAEAMTVLRTLETEFRRVHLPPPSREKPFPDAVRLEELGQIKRLLDRIAAVDTKLRGAAVPVDDKIWARHRTELDGLDRLIRFDTILVGTTKAICEAVSSQSLEGITAAVATSDLGARVDVLEELLRQRAELLAIR